MFAYLFDVDGVLTNSQTRKISKPELITNLVSKLHEGSPLGFISGRGMLWLRSSVVKVLENYLGDHPGFNKNILDNIFVAGEFGGVICVHKNGVRLESVNKKFAIPEEAQRGLHLVTFQYSDYIFVETEKQTVFSVASKIGIKDNEFELRKNNIIQEFQEVVASFPDLEVQTDRMAINVRNKEANKSYATDIFINWLKEKGVIPEKFIVFGDSPTDLEMGEQLHQKQQPFDFIYVGNKSELANASHQFQVTVTKGNLDEGTLEYLTQH